MKKDELIFGFAYGILNINEIDEEYLNDEFFIESLDYNIDSFKRIPDIYKTKNVCKKILEFDFNYLEYLEYIPDVIISEILKKREYDGVYLIKVLKDKYKTKELCEKAIKFDGTLIEYIPDKYMTKELVMEAFKTNVYVIKYIDDKYKTKELCIKSIKNSTFEALSFVPDNMIDQEICNLAIKYNSNNIKYVPERFITQEIINKVIESSGTNLLYIPERFITQELVERAVSKNLDLLEYIDDKYKTEDMCYNSVINYPELLSFVPDKYLKNIKTRLVKKYYNDYINKRNITKELNILSEEIKYLKAMKKTNTLSEMMNKTKIKTLEEM